MSVTCINCQHMCIIAVTTAMDHHINCQLQHRKAWLGRW
jgi:hypothetical protein